MKAGQEACISAQVGLLDPTRLTTSIFWRQHVTFTFEIWRRSPSLDVAHTSSTSISQSILPTSAHQRRNLFRHLYIRCIDLKHFRALCIFQNTTAFRINDSSPCATSICVPSRPPPFAISISRGKARTHPDTSNRLERA